MLSFGGNHSHTKERGQLEHRQRVAYIYEEQEAVCQVRIAEPATAVNTERNMKYILDFFALVGLVSTIIVVCFYIGYATYNPPCHSVASILTKECKQ